MINIRRSDERGGGDFGWLNTHHTFSFDQYHDPNFMGFRSLRVINEDWVQGGHGFPMHPHRDMEIITSALDGAFEHQDSMGNGSTIRPGDGQAKSAGTGVRHSEINPSPDEKVHLLQIWILPEEPGIAPGYEQKNFPLEGRKNRLQLLASRDAREGSVLIHQDASLYGAVLDRGAVSFELKPSRHAWVHVAKGNVKLNGLALSAGDGAAVSDERSLQFEGDGELLLFDLA